MKYEILQDELTHLRTIKKGTILTVEDWQREYGIMPFELTNNPSWFREVPDFKVGGFVIFDNEIMGKILGPGIFMPNSSIIQTASRGNLEVKTNMLLPDPPIPDNMGGWKVKMKNGVPLTTVGEKKKYAPRIAYYNTATKCRIDIIDSSVDDFCYILEPVEERFTLNKDLGSENTPNFMLIEAAIRDLYRLVKGEGEK